MSKLSTSQILNIAGMSVFADVPTESLRSQLLGVSVKDEQALWQLLAEHRLLGLFFQSMVQGASVEWLPEQFRQDLAAAMRDEQLRLARLEVAFVRATRAMAGHGIPVIACKGIVLAKCYYPVRGMRRMHDLDFWLLDAKTRDAAQALEAVGFKERPNKSTAHSINFIDSMGNVLDVHFSMRLFQDRGISLEEISVLEPHLGCRVFSPEAMIAHLVTHLLGHAATQGVLLCWFVDIALVLQKREVDVFLVRRLLRDDGSWDAFLRMLRSFEDLGWTKTNVGPLIESVRPINWDGLVRQRRRAAWPGWRGKLRLAKSILLRRSQHPPYPHFRDWIWQPADWMYESKSGPGSLLGRAEHD